MRIVLYFALFLCPTLSFGQKMLESHEWCGKKHTSLSPNTFNLEDGRSDSIDILRSNITISLMGLPLVTGICDLGFVSKVDGIDALRLDLQGLTVVSVQSEIGIELTFLQVGSALHIELPQPLSTNDTSLVKIFYEGVPPTDASGWGGYYNTSGYTFNLGVGFAADPHSFGRAWFPCFDNFVERCAFDITILSPEGRKGFANGHLYLETNFPGGIAHHWSIEEPIPAYLACFASGPYTSFKRNYPGVNGPIPVEVAAAPADTNKVRNSFINLPKAIEVFEDWFGPYQWNKIGYSLVPFNSGAMEHATNIAIGRAYIDGSLNYETLWAHELTHMWWGDLATCSTAEDMWLNEGWASYGEHLFTEKVYGQTAFRNAVRANHLNVLQNAHISEGGYRAVSGLPHSLTYGTHVYNKGASIAHNLRGYLGDSLFRVGCRAAMATTQFTDWSSADFRDKLEAATGKDLHDFFEDWVFSGGYADYTVDSVKMIYSPVDAPTIAQVFVKQKLRGAPHLHHNVPLEFTFLMSDGQRQYRSGIVSGESTLLEFQFSAWGPAPRSVFVNTDLKILQARADGEKMLKNTGPANFTDAKFNLTVNNLGADSVFFRVEHHFAAPDGPGANPGGYVLTNRYWSVLTAGNSFPGSFDAQAIVIYDGRGQGDQLDNELFAATSNLEDSVLLLYRPGAGHAWKEWPSYTKVILGSNTDSWGQLRPTHILPGEYTIGKGVSTIATKEPSALGKIKVAPNPSAGKVRVMAGETFDTATLIGADGQTEKSWNFSPTTEAALDISSFPSGHYWLLIQGKKGSGICPIVKQ
ncbi:MAG: M1 family aminopeptidase [Saprospiraceae bacterium]|nr:M1 family aminopeptidase [Saprospiraceae bacterium]